jgi:hypothetical protein
MEMQRVRPSRFVLAMLALTIAGLAVLLPSTVISQAHAVHNAHATVAIDGQDVIHMRDGRRLTGRIISEDNNQIVFRYVDPNLNLQTTITLQRRDILEIERNVQTDRDDDVSIDDADAGDDDPIENSRPSDLPVGLAEGDADDESLPAFYVIPMRGQMGTDIHPDIYKQILPEIRRQNPARVVWVMNCSDREELIMPIDENRNPERGIPMLDEYRDMIAMIHRELEGIPQVIWIEDSHGISSLVALAWHDVYMSPNARLSGLRSLYNMPDRFQNVDVRAKMMAATLSSVYGFLERGNHPLEIAEAMVVPERNLSASWRGRKVQWRLDTSGEYIVNASDRQTANFNAKTSEELGISKGTVETLDDLALLEGFREYRVIEGGADAMVQRYVRDWRRTFENTQTWWADFNQHMGWATGDQAVRWLGRARADLGRIIAAMKRYQAVEIRFAQMTGMNLLAMEILEEDIRERIRVMRQGGGGGRGGGGGGGGGGGPQRSR